MTGNMNRRSFLKGTALAIGASAAVGALSGCATGPQPVAQAEAALPEGFTAEDFEASAAEYEPISDFSDEKTYDVVVVGAGTAGLPAVLTALEEGATVACLQKEPTTISQGNNSSGMILEESTENAVNKWMQAYRKAVQYRTNLAQLQFFALHSGETLCWLDKMAEEVGYPACTYNDTTRTYEEEVASFRRHTFGEKPENHGKLIEALAGLAEQRGADFFYSTPGVQLLMEDGACVGVVGKAQDGYIKFNATQAVIVATGDYQNNESLVRRYSPDAAPFARKQVNKTGDGILMCALAGGWMSHVGHAKQFHDMDSAPKPIAELPFLAVDMNGERFMNEDILMISWNLTLSEKNTAGDDPGVFCRIFDSSYPEKIATWGGTAPKPEALEKYIPGLVENPKGVYPDLVNTHRCDTLDELAGELGIPADNLKASVARFNEMCAKGKDTDFGLDERFLQPIDTPPYWGVSQWVRVSAICSGLVVDGNYQVVDRERNPIPGLYAVGFCAGELCGNHDWIYTDGMAAGSCFTSGRYATIHAITGALSPAKPVAWDEVKGLYADAPKAVGA